MSIDELRIFVAVAQTLNFTQAADDLHFSQPTLSRRISDLENKLGHKLFVRTTRRVELTEFGQNFLLEAKRLLKNYDQLLDQISNLGKQSFGSLIIGTPDLMTSSFLPTAINNYSAKYPGVLVDVRIIQPGACINMLKNRIIDLGFFASTDSDFSSPNIQVMSISSGDLVLVTNRTHKLASYTKVNLSDLSGERIYLSNRNNTPFLWNSVNHFLAQNDISSSSVEEIDSPGAIAMLVESGLGVTIMASNIVKELGNASRLHYLPLDGMNHNSKLNVAWNRNTTNPCVQNFINELTKVKPFIKEPS